MKFWRVLLPVTRRLVRLKVFAKRLVKLPVVAKNEVLVLLVVVEFNPVKFWKVDEPYESKVAPVMLPRVAFPALSTVAKRLVEEAVVAKRLVVVAALPVALMKVKFWRVDEPVARKLVVVA